LAEGRNVGKQIHTASQYMGCTKLNKSLTKAPYNPQVEEVGLKIDRCIRGRGM